MPSGTSNVDVAAKDYAGNLRTTTYEVTQSATAKTLTYDANGNLTGDGTRTFEWDAENRLLAVEEGTHRSEFTYDGQSRRVRIVEKDNGSITSDTVYLWCGLATCEERDSTGATTNKRFFSQGEQQGADEFFYTRDHLGSIRELTDNSAALTARYDYDPYGRRSKLSGSGDTIFGFTGHLSHADSDLVLALYRAYDPELGRWISQDPIDLAGGPNLYAYVFNNPTGLVDPFGLDALQNFLDFSSGASSVLTFGITDEINRALGNDEFIDKCSGWHTAGTAAGIGLSIAIGGAAGAQAAKANAGKKAYEFSHWIPTRHGGPRSIWNGNYVSEKLHYLTDPFRYPRGYQKWGPKLPAAAKHLLRFPWVYVGGIAGAGYGGTSAAVNKECCKR